MALQATVKDRREDVSEQFIALQKRLNAPNRRLRHELERARREEYSPIFTAYGVRGGEWTGYLLRLLPTLLLSALIGCFLAYAPTLGHSVAISDTMSLSLPQLNHIGFSWALYAKTTLMSAVAYGYIFQSRKKLRVRGWLITGIPMCAVLYALYYAFF